MSMGIALAVAASVLVRAHDRGGQDRDTGPATLRNVPGCFENDCRRRDVDE